MKIDRHARQSAKKFFRACLRSDGSLDEQAVREAVRFLVTEKPRGHFAVLHRLQQLIRLSIDERTIHVESASPLPDNGASIFSDLEQRYGPAAEKRYETNPALVGGLRVRRGSTIWDGSVSGRLARLEQALS